MYGLRLPDGLGLHYITSEREWLSEAQAEKKFVLLSRPTETTAVSMGALAAFKEGGGVADPAVLCADLQTFFSTYIRWPNAHTPLILALWTMGTYMYQLFQHYPYVIINSATRGCGKSLVLELLQEVVFLPLVRCMPTPAGLFRLAHANGGTILVDESETLTEADREIQASMMALLAEGFTPKGVIERNEPTRKGKYELYKYRIFCPKALAGINPAASILRDRAFLIFMRRKTGALPRFQPAKLRPLLSSLRDRLHIFGLLHAPTVYTIYSDEVLPLPEGFGDRGVNLYSSLAALARLAHMEPEFLAALAGVHVARQADQESVEGELATVRAIFRAALTRRGVDELVWTVVEVMGVLQESGIPGVQWEKKAIETMRQLEIPAQTYPRGEGVVRGYRIVRAQLEKEE